MRKKRGPFLPRGLSTDFEKYFSGCIEKCLFSILSLRKLVKPTNLVSLDIFPRLGVRELTLFSEKRRILGFLLIKRLIKIPY